MHPPKVDTGPNAALWAEKRAANQARDQRALDIARALGWEPVVVWECELKTDPEVVVRRVGAATDNAA
jgi:DNA mismatch endonuclease (patch repair protein)